MAGDHPDYIILLRNPWTLAISVIGNDGHAEPFTSEAAAKAWADTSKVCAAWPFQIVECNEL